MNRDEGIDNGMGEGEERISLWKLDQLMRGELPEAEASALRTRVSRSPEAQAYLERYTSLRSNLSLADIRAGAKRRLAGARSEASAARSGDSPPSTAWERVMDFLLSRGGTRGPGLAFAMVLVLGIGLWTWRVQESHPTLVESSGDGIHSIKGSGEAGFRLAIGGAEFDTGQLVSARNGDTLAIAYRSPSAVTAQVWYREEGGEPLPMAGAAAAVGLAPAMGWRRMKESIVLDGEWKRQTVWVVWSPIPFTAAQAKSAVAALVAAQAAGKAAGKGDEKAPAEAEGLRVAAFRMVRQP